MRICVLLQREKERECERGLYYHYIHQLLLGRYYYTSITIISYLLLITIMLF